MDKLIDSIVNSRSEFFNPLAVEQVIRRQLPTGRVIGIQPIIGEGVGDGTRLFRFHYNDGNLVELVIKIGQGIGQKEHSGRTLLSPYLPLAETVATKDDDAFLYKFIPGLSVSFLVNQDSPRAQNYLSAFCKTTVEMWLKTLQTVSTTALCGYQTKFQSTAAMVGDFRLGNLPFSQLADLEVEVNSRRLPPFSYCIEEIKKLILPAKEVVSAIQHGDEGAGNCIIRDNDEQLFFIDNGNAGRRQITEGVAKLIMFWATTPTRSYCQYRLENNHLVFNYSLEMPQNIRQLIKKMMQELLEQLTGVLDSQQLSACLALFCLRQWLWTVKRSNPMALETLMAMAFEAISGIFLNRLIVPGFPF